MSSRRDELSKAEEEVLKALWHLGSATVREVHERLTRDRPRAYTTVLTFLGSRAPRPRWGLKMVRENSSKGDLS